MRAYFENYNWSVYGRDLYIYKPQAAMKPLVRGGFAASVSVFAYHSASFYNFSLNFSLRYRAPGPVTVVLPLRTL